MLREWILLKEEENVEGVLITKEINKKYVHEDDVITVMVEVKETITVAYE